MFGRRCSLRDPRLRAMLDSAAEAVIVIDERGMIRVFNRAAQAMFGYGAEEALGQHVRALMPAGAAAAAAHEHERAVQQYLNGGRASAAWTSRQVLGRRKDGQTFPVELAVSEFRIGRRRAFVGFLMDVTERKELERRVLDVSECQQRRIGKEVHEGLCQELAGLAFLADAVQRKLVDTGAGEAAEAAELATVARRALRHARGLARGLDPVATVPHGLAAALAQLVSDTADAAATECLFHHPQPVEVDDPLVAVQLYRIAQDAIGQAVRERHATRVVVALVRDAGALELGIRDDGGAGGRSDCVSCILAHRARAIGAVLTVEEGPNHRTGLRVICRLAVERQTRSSHEQEQAICRCR
jgi:PAS domain S-box-containing protein